MIESTCMYAHTQLHTYISTYVPYVFVLGVVAEWYKVLTAVP